MSTLKTNRIENLTTTDGGISIDNGGRVSIANTSASSLYAGGNNLVVGDGAGDEGMTIYTGNNKQGIVAFADGFTGAAQQYAGYLLYDHNSDYMSFATTGGERLRIDSSGNVALRGAADVRLTLGSAGSIGSNDSNYIRAATDQIIYNSATSSGRHSFELAGSEKMRLDSNGRLGIGVITPADTLHVRGPSSGTILNLDRAGSYSWKIGQTSGSDLTITGDTSERVRILTSGNFYSRGDLDSHTAVSGASAGTSYFLYRGRRGTTITGSTTAFIVWSNGNVQNSLDSYGQISDIKLKENIVDAPSQWDDFKAIRFRKYNFKEETGHETFTQLGVIAQEVEQVCPGLVYETADRDEEGNDLGTTTKAVKSSILTKKALVALQEAMERIETLEAEVAALKSN